MGRKQQRKRQKQKRKIKKNILTRGNIFCNAFPAKNETSSSSGTLTVTLCGVSGIQTLASSCNLYGESLKESKKASQAPTDIEKRATSFRSTESMTTEKNKNETVVPKTLKRSFVTFHADPLIVGLREYQMIKKRLEDIKSRPAIR